MANISDERAMSNRAESWTRKVMSEPHQRGFLDKLDAAGTNGCFELKPLPGLKLRTIGEMLTRNRGERRRIRCFALRGSCGRILSELRS